MFGTLTDRFSSVFRSLSGRGKITPSSVREAMNEVRTALLEADVHLEVVDSFIQRVMEKATGTEVLASLKPGQQMISIVHDELLELMGPVDSHIMYVQPGPTVIMMCGSTGSGKTTTLREACRVSTKTRQTRHTGRGRPAAPGCCQAARGTR